MNMLLYLSVGLHFKILGSTLFGGENSVGYTEASYGGVSDMGCINDELVESTIKSMASMAEVPLESVILISKEAYDLATKERDEDFGDWDE